MKSLSQRVLLACAAISFSQVSFSFGIDRISAQLDVAGGFKSTETFVIFNDGRENAIFTTAKALKWETKPDGQMILTPSEDLQIFPSVQRIGAGESATFKVRYRGAPLQGEGYYRVLFEEIQLPTIGTTKGDENSIGTTSQISSAVTAGLAMTVPVYVSNFAVKADSLDRVTVRLVKEGSKLFAEVDNQTNRYIVITGCKVNGVESGPKGVVFALHKRLIAIDSDSTIKELSVTVSYGGASRNIRLDERQ